jgi:hypothetical protein
MIIKNYLIPDAMKLTVPYILFLSVIFFGCNHSNKPDISKITSYEIGKVPKISGDNSKTSSCCSTLNKVLQKHKASLKAKAECKQ